MTFCFPSWKPKFKIMVSLSKKSFHLKILIDFGGGKEGNFNNGLLPLSLLLNLRPGCDNSGNTPRSLLCFLKQQFIHQSA